MGVGYVLQEKDGEWIVRAKGKNILTNVGKEFIAERWGFDTRPNFPNAITHIALGSGITPPAVTDGSLDVEEERQAITGLNNLLPGFFDIGLTGTRQIPTFSINHTFTVAYTLSEAAILVAGAPDILVARWLYNVPAAFGIGDSATILWGGDTV